MSDEKRMTMEQLQARGPVMPPSGVDPIAADVLRAFQRTPEAKNVILGGYFALKHYVDYRMTADIDGWWPPQLNDRERADTAAMLWASVRDVGRVYGMVPIERKSARVVSFEMQRKEGEKSSTVFSVQMSQRDVELDPPVLSPWPPVRIETLRDNLGAKMSALVERGAPRDFTDIYEVVRRGVVDADRCWSLWAEKNLGSDLVGAKLQVLHHLEAIELRRPLDETPADRRGRIAETREFFRGEFTGRDLARDRGVDVERDGDELER